MRTRKERQTYKVLPCLRKTLHRLVREGERYIGPCDFMGGKPYRVTVVKAVGLC